MYKGKSKKFQIFSFSNVFINAFCHRCNNFTFRFIYEFQQYDKFHMVKTIENNFDCILDVSISAVIINSNRRLYKKIEKKRGNQLVKHRCRSHRIIVFSCSSDREFKTHSPHVINFFRLLNLLWLRAKLIFFDPSAVPISVDRIFWFLSPKMTNKRLLLSNYGIFTSFEVEKSTKFAN